GRLECRLRRRHSVGLDLAAGGEEAGDDQWRGLEIGEVVDNPVRLGPGPPGVPALDVDPERRPSGRSSRRRAERSGEGAGERPEAGPQRPGGTGGTGGTGGGPGQRGGGYAVHAGFDLKGLDV